MIHPTKPSKGRSQRQHQRPQDGQRMLFSESADPKHQKALERVTAFTESFNNQIMQTLLTEFYSAHDRYSETFSFKQPGVLNAPVYRKRIRKHVDLEDLRNDFLLYDYRVGRDRAKTELEEIHDGSGDFLFYGFANPNNSQIQCWWLGDLQVFRSYLNSQIRKSGKIIVPRLTAHSTGDLPSWIFSVGSVQRFAIERETTFIVCKGGDWPKQV